MSKTIGEIREANDGTIFLVVMHQGNRAPRCIIRGGWDCDEDGGAERLTRDVIDLFRCSADTYTFVKDWEDFDLLSPEDDDGEAEPLATLCVEEDKWVVEFEDKRYWDTYGMHALNEYFCKEAKIHGIEVRGYESVNYGICNRASHNRCVAVGYSNTANASESLTLGIRNVSSGLGSVSVGANNRCENGELNAAFGSENMVDGDRCAAFGITNKTHGSWSAAVGINNTTSSYGTAAVGLDCEAKRSGSMVVGINAMSKKENEMVLGGQGIKTVTVQVFGHEDVDLLAKLDELERRIAMLEGGK